MILNEYPKKQPSELITLVEALEQNARLFGDETALVERDFRKETHGRKEITWREFERRSNSFAQLLLSGGLQKGDKVAVLLVNSIEWLPVFFGILKSGGVAVPLNYRYTSGEIQYCLEKADCSVLVFGNEFLARMEEIKNSIPRVKSIYFLGEETPAFAQNFEAAIGKASDRSPQTDISPADNAAIYFSSGTTGFPKAILHTHGSLLHAAIAEQVHHMQAHDDVFLCIPPLFHTGSKIFWFGSLLVGGRAVLLRGVRPEWILQAVSEEQCTIVWLLVPWAQDILDALDHGEINLSDYSLEQWRLMHIGAQPVPPSLVSRWLKHFPKHQYDTDYGLTESAGPGCVHLGIENISKVGSIGKAGYGWKTKVVDENGDTVAPGEVGELCVCGPCVMECYYNDSDSTRDALRDGWLFTGDMVTEDKNGFLYLVDRKKDVIIVGGENIYPVQIEDFIRSHDCVRDAAVIAFPDKRLGEIPCAIIEVKPDKSLSEAEVNEFCLALPRYKRPRRIIFAQVPRNSTGKIEKTVLRERYCKPNE